MNPQSSIIASEKAERKTCDQVGAPAEEDLKNWGQHSGPGTVPDEILQRVGEELPGTITFVFTCQVRNCNCQDLSCPKSTARQ